MNDITFLKRAMAAKAREIAQYLLPGGQAHGREFEAGSVAGEKGQSLRVCISGPKAGIWSDFASGQSGDLIELWRIVKNVRLGEALADIRNWLGIDEKPFDRPERSYRRPEKPKGQAPQSAVLDYLTGERCLSEEAIVAYRIGENGRTIIFQNFLPDGTLAGVKYLGIDRPNGKKVTRVEADCEPVLFGWQAISDDAREITITEGELDAVAMWDYSYPALSVPFGGGGGKKQQWIEAEYDRLFRFEVINLALDNDAEGDIAAEEIANRLGRHRCRRVRLMHKDAAECRKHHVPQHDIALAFQAASTLDPPELRRSGSFVEAVTRLFYPAGEREIGWRLPFAKIGDKFICRPGELTLWTGCPGEGKSQLLSHCTVAWIADGARICEASLEMSPAQQLKRKLKQAGNVDRPTKEYIQAMIDWFDDGLWITAGARKSEIKKLLEIFEYARCRYGCDVFVVDSLMRLGVSPEDFSAQEKVIYELTEWTVERNVHLHLVAHSRKPDTRGGHAVPAVADVKGTTEIAANAFNIIGVWRNRQHEEKIRDAQEKVNSGNDGAKIELDDLLKKPPVLMNIAKQRSGDFEGIVGLWFNRDTYQYRSSIDPKEGRKFISMNRQNEEI